MEQATVATLLGAALGGLGAAIGGLFAPMVDSAAGALADGLLGGADGEGVALAGAAGDALDAAASDETDAEAAAAGEKCSFSADTQVATPTGEQAIASLHLGDTVLANDPTMGKAEPELVQHVWVNHDSDLVDVGLQGSAGSGPAPTVAATAASSAPSRSKQLVAASLALAAALAISGQAGAPAAHAAQAAHAVSSQATPATTETIHTTAKHPWLTADRGWVTAGDLRVGEHVVELGGRTATITALAVRPGATDYYNLTVSELHTYAVGNHQFVVHNCTGGETGSGGPAGARNGAPAVLPPYDGATTEGWLVTNEGDIVPLTSGNSQLPRYPAAGHVEGKAALEIRARESSGGTVWHNNPNGTCNYCNTQIPTLLPEGSTLTVVPPEGASAPNRFWFDQPMQYTGNARTPNGM